MNDFAFLGNLAEDLLPQVFFKLWQKGLSGRLRLESEGEERIISFSSGNAALEEDFLSALAFQRKLVGEKMLAEQDAERAKAYAETNGLWLPRAILELGLLSPDYLWEKMISFWKESLYVTFDWSVGRFAFNPAEEASRGHFLAILSTPDLILQGVRRMQNHSLIEAFLPPESESIRVFSPDYAKTLILSTYEKYILGLVGRFPRLQDIYTFSQLGKRESQKVLYAFFQLNLVGLSPSKNKGKSSAEVTPGELEKIWNDFNDRCSFIYKYTSKEIGPVALSVLEKALEEVKPRLSPLFQHLELGLDGRIEIKSAVPYVSPNLAHEGIRKNFINDLNEILVAEVLAIKRTLGNVHEAVLVRNLEKIRELS